MQTHTPHPKLKPYLRFYPLFKKAYDLALYAHRDQKRKTGAHYMTHIDAVILGTVRILDTANISEERFFLTCLCVAALHDVVEDNPETNEEYVLAALWEGLEVTQANSDIIAQIMAGLYCITKLSTDASYVTYILRVLRERSSVVVKLADLTHNLSDQTNKDKKDKYQLAHYVLSQINLETGSPK